MRQTLFAFSLLLLASCTTTPVDVSNGDGPPPNINIGDASVISDFAAPVTCTPACSGATPHCNANLTCVACLVDSDCPFDTTCHAGACTPGCNTDDRCQVDGGSPGAACCSMSCTDTSKDPLNCGACGMGCQFPNAQASCTSSACSIGSCNAGYGDCNKTPADGCESNFHVDPENCGSCGSSCAGANAQNAIWGCSDGCYIRACQFGWDDCDVTPDNGCEISVLSDPKNCGSCGTNCAAPHATTTCQVANCTIGKCAVNYLDCNGQYADGCETFVGTDVNNCGACGNACPQGQVCVNGGCTCAGCMYPNAITACVNNQCVLTGCVAGFGDCNGKPADGCEIDLTSDANNCSACGMVCPQNTPSCGSGVCTNLYSPVGIQTNVPVAQLAGWAVCYKDTYNIAMTTPGILQACTGSKLALACRPNNAATLSLFAWAPRADVIFDTGNGNVPHTANNVEWYFNATWSWGFAGPGEALARNECDTNAGADRLCWHTGIGAGGYRCGSNAGLNGDATWDRLVYQAN